MAVGNYGKGCRKLLQLIMRVKTKYLLLTIISIFLPLYIACKKTIPSSPPKMKNMVKKVEFEFSIDAGDIATIDKNEPYQFYDKTTNIILNGHAQIYSYYTATGDDNPKLVPYLEAEGTFKNGYYHGLWKFYNSDGKILKKERYSDGIRR